MTATQVFFLFLKEECLIDEIRFFKWTIMKECGNKYFSKRPLFKPTFVEDYLSRNNRALNNFMTRLFILAPNLKKNRIRNPRWKKIIQEYHDRNCGKTILVRVKDLNGNEIGETYRKPCVFRTYDSGMYVKYYQRKWNKFLNEKIESDKKFNSPFKKGEVYNFKLKTKYDTN